MASLAQVGICAGVAADLAYRLALQRKSACVLIERGDLATNLRKHRQNG